MHTKHLCLGALSLQDGTGYDIKKLFEAAFSHFQTASYSSIYPSLKQLEKEGDVTHHIETGDKHPDRKLFKITEQGKHNFINQLLETKATESIRSDFLVLMFFAHLLPTDVLNEKLNEIENYYQQELTYLDSIVKNPCMSIGMNYGIKMGISVYKTKLEHLQEYREDLLKNHKAPPEECIEELL